MAIAFALLPLHVFSSSWLLIEHANVGNVLLRLPASGDMLTQGFAVKLNLLLRASIVQVFPHPQDLPGVRDSPFNAPTKDVFPLRNRDGAIGAVACHVEVEGYGLVETGG